MTKTASWAQVYDLRPAISLAGCRNLPKVTLPLTIALHTRAFTRRPGPDKLPAYTKQVSFDEDSLLGSTIKSTPVDCDARFSKSNQTDAHEKRRLLSPNNAVENDAMADVRHGGVLRGAGLVPVPKIEVTVQEISDKALGIPQIAYAHTCNISLKCPCKGNAESVPPSNPSQCDQNMPNGINPSSAIQEQLSGDIWEKLRNQKAVDV